MKADQLIWLLKGAEKDGADLSELDIDFLDAEYGPSTVRSIVLTEDAFLLDNSSTPTVNTGERLLQ